MRHVLSVFKIIIRRVKQEWHLSPSFRFLRAAFVVTFLLLGACQKGTTECPLLGVPAGTDRLSLTQGYVQIDGLSGNCNLSSDESLQSLDLVLSLHLTDESETAAPEQNDPYIFVGIIHADHGIIAKEFFTIPLRTAIESSDSVFSQSYSVALSKRDHTDFAELVIVVGFLSGT